MLTSYRSRLGKTYHRIKTENANPMKQPSRGVPWTKCEEEGQISESIEAQVIMQPWFYTFMCELPETQRRRTER